jgi:prevent-host-death family protein
MTRITGRDFNQDVGRAKRAATKGPVIITDRGKPAFVLMRHETYERLSSQAPSIRALLAQPKGADIDFEAPRLGDEPAQAVDLH